MERADFTLPVTPEQKEKMERDTKELIIMLRTVPQIKVMVEKGYIPASCIDKYPWKLKEWLKAIEPCIGCTGLANCKQKTKGYYEALHYDGILQNSLKACKYMRVEVKAESHLKYYASNDLPKNMHTISLLDNDVKNESAEYIKVFAEVLKSSEAGQSIYLYGNMGTGKTYLAAGACNDHARNKERVAFIHYPTFCGRMAGAVRDNEYQRELDSLKLVQFLVIDDIGAENVTEWNRDSLLLPLLNARYDAHLPTWFTSNCDLDSLKIHFTFSSKGAQDELKAARIMERIEAMAKVQALTGKDRRK
jgi:primosomal protein DnaI